LVGLLAAGLLVVGGCDSGGEEETENLAPTVELKSPASNLAVDPGDMVSIVYADEDPEGSASTNLYADADGNLATTGDQIVIATGRPANGGLDQTVPWNTAGVPAGTYTVIARTSDGRNTVSDTANGTVTVRALDHTNIILRDSAGDAILAGSTVPYSPRQTCGRCHDVDAIANGYHFQQGRTDDTGAVVMKDDYFDDGRDWLKSAGMYGKW
jgi:hypothetical protein